MKYYNCCDCNEKATWMYSPGKSYKEDSYCDFHVPKGCSCNIESFYFEGNSFSKDEQINYFLERKHFKILNYGNKIHNNGKHLEEITDLNLIKSMFYNFTEEQLLHLSIVPLDNNKNEFPCVEYDYYENGISIEKDDEEEHD